MLGLIQGKPPHTVTICGASVKPEEEERQGTNDKRLVRHRDGGQCKV